GQSLSHPRSRRYGGARSESLAMVVTMVDGDRWDQGGSLRLGELSRTTSHADRSNFRYRVSVSWDGQTPSSSASRSRHRWYTRKASARLPAAAWARINVRYVDSRNGANTSASSASVTASPGSPRSTHTWARISTERR